jgi:hypothetical protein
MGCDDDGAISLVSEGVRAIVVAAWPAGIAGKTGQIASRHGAPFLHRADPCCQDDAGRHGPDAARGHRLAPSAQSGRQRKRGGGAEASSPSSPTGPHRPTGGAAVGGRPERWGLVRLGLSTRLLLKRCLLCIKYRIKWFSESRWVERRSWLPVLAHPSRSRAPVQRTAGPAHWPPRGSSRGGAQRSLF